MCRRQKRVIPQSVAVVTVVGALAWAAVGRAQELEPGTYQNAPVDVNVLIAGYGLSGGNVLVDASLPIEDATATMHGIALGYLRTSRLAGRSAKLDVQVPLSWGRFEGLVEGQQRERTLSGIADPRVRFAINLFGSPALERREFATFRQRTIIGASLQIGLPLGQYDRDRVINLGANRWSFRPEVGVSRAAGRWIFEAAAGSWLFGTNNAYFGNTVLTQASIMFVKGNVIRMLGRGRWLSVSYGLARGGETRVDDVPRSNLQSNNRVAATLALPLTQAGAIRIAYTNGLTTRQGADFDALGVSYQYTWGEGPKSP
jgi:hypothetical protein